MLYVSLRDMMDPHLLLLTTHTCLYGGVFPHFEVTGHPVPVSSLGFKCLDCFIWNCSYIVYSFQR